MIFLENVKNKINALVGSKANLIRQERILINQGLLLSKFNSTQQLATLAGYEWKVFSQWGEDGIIDFLVTEVEIESRTFIEFGVENFNESNCRFLMMSRDWSGFVVDGSKENIEQIKQSYYFWQYDLQAEAKFITKENVTDTLKMSGYDKDIGILSIDIDGNDYHIFESIQYYEPRIIICEFNPAFGLERAISVPYDHDFYRTDKHYSNLYYGASISAFSHLANKKGYTLVGTGMQGGNCFFVKDSLMTPLLTKLAKNPMSFNFNYRESRDQDGNLSLLKGEEIDNIIKGLKVINVQDGKPEEL